MSTKHRGFTIVELLIVIVVIAILAAIGIVAYSGVQERAQQSALQANLRDSFMQVQLFHAEQGRYPTTYAELESLDITLDPNLYWGDTHSIMYCYTSDHTKAAIAAAAPGLGSADSSNRWTYGTNGIQQGFDWGNGQQARCNNALGVGSGANFLVGVGPNSRNWQPWTGHTGENGNHLN